MHETPFSYSQLESPAPGATLPQGRHLLRGWVWPKTGGHFVDVRARIGGQIFPGVHGFPRADLAAHFQTGRPVALAEFQVAVDLAPGDVEVMLEVLELEGRWRTFGTIAYVVMPSGTPQDFTLPSGPLRWIDHGHGLRQLLRESARQPARDLGQLAAMLTAELPWPRVLRDAPAPLVGFVDEPASVCCCQFGRIPAFGHLFHPELNIRRILATVDLQGWQTLEIHLPSPGPGAHYSQFPHARACGFTGLVDVPSQLPNPVSLRIYAELEDGSLHLGPVVRSRLHTQDDEKLPLATGTGPDFAAALAAWDTALAARGLPVTRDRTLADFLATLGHAHEQSRSSRPAGPAPAPVDISVSRIANLPRRVLLATHGLSLQGAPRFLLELGRALVAAGAAIDVVSAEEGPLRAEFESLGARVRLADCSPVMTADTPAAAKLALAGLTIASNWAEADLVIANSFTTFWAVHAAKAASRPVLLYVHESTTPAVFFGQRVPGQVIALTEQAFALADAVSFTTVSTRNCHLGYGLPERHHLTPGWVDLTALDRWRATQDREAMRRALGVQPGERLVCNIGTVSDRKGQHTFARAADLLDRRHPALAAHTRFILLGGRDTPFDTMLGDALADLAPRNFSIHPETSNYLRYYAAADLFACSSYEESSPRVIFEAMALNTPIIASAVHGVPELVRPDLEATLLPAGDTIAWCEGLARLLAAPEAGRELAASARARAEALFSAPAVLPRHLALCSAVADGHFTSMRAQ